jgi:ppGpp synthetase/RelA/SpoT-type nucleotidyltranferase
MFDAYAEGKTELTAEVKELYEKAKACDEEIKKLEAEKEELKQKAHEEREARRNENQ